MEKAISGVSQIAARHVMKRKRGDEPGRNVLERGDGGEKESERKKKTNNGAAASLFCCSQL